MKKMKRRAFLKTTGFPPIGAACFSTGMGTLRAEDKPGKLTKDKDVQPGEKAITSGFYDVYHDKIDGEHHAHQHQVVVKAGTVFPRCKVCHQWVKFRFAQQPLAIEKDPYFET